MTANIQRLTCCALFLSVGVLSTYLNGATETLSGTSMAFPHVAGVMIKKLAENGEICHQHPYVGQAGCFLQHEIFERKL